MTREVIAADGKHYRLKPGNHAVVQVQDKPGEHFRTHYRFYGDTAADLAATELAQLGDLRQGEAWGGFP